MKKALLITAGLIWARSRVAVVSGQMRHIPFGHTEHAGRES